MIEQILSILQQHEQIVYLPKNQRKNPLTRGIIKENFWKVAEEITNTFKKNIQYEKEHSTASTTDGTSERTR